MDYSQLSDFEINVEVFEALHGGSPDCKEGDNGEMLLVSFEADVVGGDIVEVEVVRGSFNPCNNWLEAGLIIVENKISIYAAVLGDSRGEWGAEASFTEHYHFHDNPLRAAMIVFLMMQDAKHA
ncbi:DUF2591 family protein [Enterobacter roggenkampii]|nr:DUF2591 family protein [Enterobacter roggenkampii]